MIENKQNLLFGILQNTLDSDRDLRDVIYEKCGDFLIDGKIKPFESIQLCIDDIIQYRGLNNREKKKIKNKMHAIMRKTQFLLFCKESVNALVLERKFPKRDEIAVQYHIEASLFFARASLDIITYIIVTLIFNKTVRRSYFPLLINEAKNATDPIIMNLFNIEEFHNAAFINNKNQMRYVNWLNFFVRFSERIGIPNIIYWNNAPRNIIAHEGSLTFDFEINRIKYIENGNELFNMQIDDFINYIVVGYLDFALALENIFFKYFKNTIRNTIQNMQKC